MSNGAWARIRRVFRLPPSRDRMRAELDAELRFHLEGRVEDLVEREHLSRADAEREAWRRFGDYQGYRSAVRSIDDTMFDRRHRMELFDALRRETRLALRALVRAPAFSLIALLTLALGLGAATTIFTLLDRVVLRPLPYAKGDRLLHIGTLWPKVKEGEEYAISRGQFFYFKKNSAALADLGLYDTGVIPVPGDGMHPAERVPVVMASASLFDVLDIHAERGRLFTAEEGVPDDPSVALITHEYWARRFGSDPSILGKRLQVGGGSVEIIGVLPPGSNVPEYTADVWIPNHLDPAEAPINNHTHTAIGVLKPGVTVAAAAADIDRLQSQLAAAYPRVYPPVFIERVGFAMHVSSLRDHILGPRVARAFWIIFAAVGLVLLIAAANVANLFLVRIDARRREVALRSALGAGRSQLAIHWISESALLSVAAGACAIGLGYALLRIVLAFAPQSLPRLAEVHFDGRAVAFCFVCAALFGVVFGLLPLGATGGDVAALREGGRGLTISRRRDLVRRGLVVTQVALAVVLLSAAALMVRSFQNLRNVRPGFDPTGVQTMTVVLPYARYEKYQQREVFWRELARRVEAVPGVQRAGLADALPLTGAWGCTGISMDAGRTTPAQSQCMPLIAVSPGYFEAMGIPVAGRSPSWSDVEGQQGPVVVSAAFARRFWPDENGVGHTVLPPGNTGRPRLPVVGVAGDIRADGLQKPPLEAVYLPLLPAAGWSNWNMVGNQMTLVVRAPSVDARALVASVRRILTELDPNVPLSDVRSMEVIVARSMAQTSFIMLLLLIASAIALVLSAVGIYGVIGYLVAQRRTEIGIRMALGARIAHVARMVVGQSVTLALAGVVLGAAGALATTRLLRSLLFDVRPSDPITLVGTCVVLVLVAVAASAGPARRAARVDPVEAMRG